MSYDYTNFESLKGLTLSEIIGNEQDDFLIFKTVDGQSFKMYHGQDCCESVYIESIVGDLQDLVGHPIELAEEVTQDDPQPSDGIGMWTFYKLATIKGYVDIRWYGSSNGYYGVSVDFVKIN